MPKNKLSEYSSTASDNTDIGGINIAEGMAPSDVNNAMREQMVQLKEFIDGSSGDTVTTAKIVATTAQILSGASVTGTATFNSPVVMSALLTGTTANITGAVTIGGAAVLSSTLNVTGATTLGGAAVLSSTLSVANTATMGVVQMADNNLIRPKLLDYALKGNALGNVGTAATVNFESGNFFSATSTAATTWAFTNPVASGDFGGFVLELNNGGAYTQAWPAAVDWPAGTPPTLTASGKDILVFVTRDAGTTYHGMAASLDSK
jgi:hypothetical protein